MKKQPATLSKKRRGLTPKDLGLVDDVKLSESYRNERDNYKVVEPYVLGYYVAGGSRAPVRIAPIYRAWIYYVHKKVMHIVESHEVGAYLNPIRPADEEPDTDGDALAYLASTALGALARHAEREAATKKRGRGQSR